MAGQYKRGDTVWIMFYGDRHSTRCKVTKVHKDGTYDVQSCPVTTEGLDPRYLHSSPPEFDSPRSRDSV